MGQFAQRDSIFSRAYTVVYQTVAGEAEPILLHARHEAAGSPKQAENRPMVHLSTYQFIRDILTNKPDSGRIPVSTGTAARYVSPHIIFYVQSKKRKTDLYCADKVIQSDLTINEINAMLLP